MYPLLECLCALAVAVGEHLGAAQAEMIYRRALLMAFGVATQGAFEWTSTGKERRGGARDEGEEEADLCIVALDLIGSLVQGASLPPSILERSGRAEGPSVATSLDMIVLSCATSALSEVRQSAFGLLGDLAHAHAPTVLDLLDGTTAAAFAAAAASASPVSSPSASPHHHLAAVDGGRHQRSLFAILAANMDFLAAPRDGFGNMRGSANNAVWSLGEVVQAFPGESARCLGPDAGGSTGALIGHVAGIYEAACMAYEGVQGRRGHEAHDEEAMRATVTRGFLENCVVCLGRLMDLHNREMAAATGGSSSMGGGREAVAGRIQRILPMWTVHIVSVSSALERESAWQPVLAYLASPAGRHVLWADDGEGVRRLGGVLRAISDSKRTTATLEAAFGAFVGGLRAYACESLGLAAGQWRQLCAAALEGRTNGMQAFERRFPAARA